MLKWIKSLFTAWPQDEEYKPTCYSILTVYLQDGSRASIEMKKEVIEEILQKISGEWSNLSVTTNYYGICFRHVTHYKVEYTERPELK